ncbi:MAG: hypothetical protein K8R21_15340 [Leptospira sp.]|nr:hypothetical protein [Leptospira sp.]
MKKGIFIIPVIFIYGLAKAVSFRWVCDDAFISFRYAKNLIQGAGLVFNQGEQVEGFTNFLWTILIALAMNAGFDPVMISWLFGIIFFAGTLLILVYFSGKIVRPDSKFFIPVAFAGFAFHKHAAIFATSGLETSAFTFFITAGTCFVLESKTRFRTTFGFFLLTLSAMTRPEGVLFYFFGALYSGAVFLREKNHSSFRSFFFLHIPFILLFFPFFIWKYCYYGWIFPNTFYAKSGEKFFFGQGLRYLALYFNSYYLFYLIPFLLCFAFLKRKMIPAGNSAKIAFLSFSVSVYLIYVAKVGGDFMFARFLIPITPFLYLLIEWSIISLISGRDTKLFRLWPQSINPVSVIAVGIALLTLGHYDQYKGLPVPLLNGIANENEIYKPAVIQKAGKIAQSWRETFRSNSVRLAFGGSQAVLVYYSDPALAIEAETGLTDEFLAHREIDGRGRIGHEKNAPLEYLEKRKVHIHMNPGNLPGRMAYNVINVRNLGEMRIITYEKKVMESLKKTGDFEFTDFESYLDKYIQSRDRRTKEDLRADYEKFKIYYFNHNSDARRQEFFEKAINE